MKTAVATRVTDARRWLAVVLTAASLAASADCGLRIFEATLQDVNEALATGCATSEQLTARYLARIEAFEPDINAVIAVNEAALDEARQLDAERRLQGPRGALHGVPVLLKDNVDTAGMVTTAGTAALRDSVPGSNATIVTRLREAGAVIVAKTNLSELAQSHGRLGYSALGGLTRNPYDLTRDASGSSTGSAAGLAAGFGVLAIGTDTAGSVRGPASTTGLVGLRPTLGLVSRAGIAPVAHTLDTPGPMARSVYGVAAMLEVIAGPDVDDPRTAESAAHARKDYTRFLDSNALAGARIGVARDFMGGNPEVDALVEDSVQTLRELGAELVTVELPEAVKVAGRYLPAVIAAEFRPQFQAYLRSLERDFPSSVPDVARVGELWGNAIPEQAMNPKLLESLEKAAEHAGLADIDYLYTVSNRYPAARTALAHLFDEQRLAAIVFPTLACPPAPLPGEPQGRYVCLVDDVHNASYLRVASVTGFPDISVPTGQTRAGLPVGLSFLGLPYSEPTLLALAYGFEQRTQARRPPASTPALNRP